MLETPTVERTPLDSVDYATWTYTIVRSSSPANALTPSASHTEQMYVAEYVVPYNYDYRLDPSAHPNSLADDDTVSRFRALANGWRSARGVLSSAQQMASHPDYLRIIDIGESVVPLILEDLRVAPDHWFVALHAITGANPVPEDARGRLKEMADAWVRWGKQHGYI